MRRIEVIVPQKKFDDVMLYLREENSVELLDVKEMIRGYGEGVNSAPTSERLYRLTTLESKINSIIAGLGVSSIQMKPVQSSNWMRWRST
jgi:vacuolar-type H+-ATPase subunit I/STV1